MSASNLASKTALRRIFVLDTNVLLFDPGSLYVFHEHDVVIPMTVIEEIDKFKKDLNETGRNARTVSRYLDGMRGKGSLKEGIALDDGGTVRVDFAMDRPAVPVAWGANTNDNLILQCAWLLSKESDRPVTLVTRDTNMRLKCDALGITAEDYEHSQIDVDEQYTGMAERTVPAAYIDALYQQGTAPVAEVGEFHPQQFVVLNADDGSGKSAMVRVDGKMTRFKLVGRHKEGIWGIFARNKEQLFAMDLLLDPSIKLVTLNGVAGTGKTRLALAC
ncbi:MAG: PhoH family protein, partial [Myxococcota bacterium]